MLATLLAAVATPSVASTFEVIYSFAYPEEGFARATPAADGRGNLYGYTDIEYCWTNCLPRGSLYRYSVGGGVYETVYRFSAEGNRAVGNPVAADGVVYGVFQGGGLNARGAAFRYDPVAGMQLLSFPADERSYVPLTGLTITPSGELFGVASIGIYKINRAFTRFTWEHSFQPAVSSNPGSMAQRNGQLFGGTRTFNFQFDPATGAFSSLPASDETFGLTFDETGGLWSVLIKSISKFDASSALVPVHKFNERTGQYPRSGMVLGDDGLLYGVTERGGACDRCGAIYSMNPVTNQYTVLHNFAKKGPNGTVPLGLVKGDDGALYGHAAGGLFAGGVLFRFVP